MNRVSQKIAERLFVEIWKTRRREWHRRTVDDTQRFIYFGFGRNSLVVYTVENFPIFFGTFYYSKKEGSGLQCQKASEL